MEGMTAQQMQQMAQTAAMAAQMLRKADLADPVAEKSVEEKMLERDAKKMAKQDGSGMVCANPNCTQGVSGGRKGCLWKDMWAKFPQGAPYGRSFCYCSRECTATMYDVRDVTAEVGVDEELPLADTFEDTNAFELYNTICVITGHHVVKNADELKKLHHGSEFSPENDPHHPGREFAPPEGTPPQSKRGGKKKQQLQLTNGGARSRRR